MPLPNEGPMKIPGVQVNSSSRTQQKKKKKSVEAPEKRMGKVQTKQNNFNLGPSAGMLNKQLPPINPIMGGIPNTGLSEQPMMPTLPLLKPPVMPDKVMMPPIQPPVMNIGPSPNVQMGGPIANPTTIGNLTGGKNTGINGGMNQPQLGGIAGRLQGPQQPKPGLFGTMKPRGTMGY